MGKQATSGERLQQALLHKHGRRADADAGSEGEGECTHWSHKPHSHPVTRRDG
jgi:hypothetical protein